MGRDGMVGLPLFLDADTDPLHAFAQVLLERVACEDYARIRDAYQAFLAR